MNACFVKFPSTPHLATLPGVNVREDKVLSEHECTEFLKCEIVIEEKVDGANLGLSFDAQSNIQARNRGVFLSLPGEGQWKKLEQWLIPRIDSLFEVLFDRYVLFGEWCFARHSVFYDQLPDWFLGFDLFDRRECRFLSCERRNELLDALNIHSTPFLGRGHYNFLEIQDFLTTSHLGSQPMEGLYFRVDASSWLQRRAKLVRPEFVQSIEKHWSHTKITPNRMGVAVHE